MTIVEALELLPVDLRVGFAHEHAADLERLDEDKLTRVGTLLCHASPYDVRAEWPIIGDLRMTEQAEFDTELFGDPDDPTRPGSYVSLREIGEEGDDGDD